MFTKIGTILRRIARNAHGMRKIARYAAAQCGYIAIGITLQKSTKSAESEKPLNGSSEPVATVGARFGYTAIGTINPNIIKSAHGMKQVVTSAIALCAFTEHGTIRQKLTRSVSKPRKLSGLKSHASIAGVQYGFIAIGMTSPTITRIALGITRIVIFADAQCAFIEHGKTRRALTKNVSSDSLQEMSRVLNAARALSFPPGSK